MEDAVVFKECAFDKDHEFGTMDFEYMRMDGAVAAAVSPHPLIADMYGFCQLSLFSEPMRKLNMEDVAVPRYERPCKRNLTLDDKEHLVPMNDLTPLQKLEMALSQAEAVALLHNHERGVIVQ